MILSPYLWRSVKVRAEVKPKVDSWVFSLCYRWSCLFFLVAGGLVALIFDTLEEKINCLVDKEFDSDDEDDPTPFKEFVDHYCFVSGTFTVDLPPNAYRGLPHPGVGPLPASGSGGAKVTVHSYYQWVPFVLFCQGVLFYVPHYLWKRYEGGIFREMVCGLSVRDYLEYNLSNYFVRSERLEALSKYVIHTFRRQRSWAYVFFACEVLNLAVVLATLFFTDWFLGGAFFSYGGSVFEAASQDPETRFDPVSVVFPQVAKCSFRYFGASGTVQLIDLMCVIPANIINEKVYLFLWVWLIFVASVTCAWLLLRLLSLLLPGLRRRILKLYTKRTVHGELECILRLVSVSDWFLLLSFARNMEQSVFSELVLAIHSELVPDPALATPGDLSVGSEST